MIMGRVAMLLPEEYRGVYAAPRSSPAVSEETVAVTQDGILGDGADSAQSKPG